MAHFLHESPCIVHVHYQVSLDDVEVDHVFLLRILRLLDFEDADVKLQEVLPQKLLDDLIIIYQLLSIDYGSALQFHVFANVLPLLYNVLALEVIVLRFQV